MTLALPSGPIAHAIGWALLHLVWQGALVAALLAAVLSRLSGRSASLRYALSCGALALIVALGVATAIRSYPGGTAPIATRSAAAVAVQPAVSTLGAMLQPSPDRVRSVIRRANEALPVIVTIWIVGVAFLSLRLILDWLRARRLVERGTSRARDPWQAIARRLSLALGVRGAVRLLESVAVEVPTVIGLVKPAILLPASTLAGLTPTQLEMILAHELAHIRRHDFLVNLLQTAVETLLFYHPAVWWISRQVRIERENCCDDLAVAVCGNPIHYARALARLEELRATPSLLSVSATGGSLLLRVRRLVSRTTAPDGVAIRGASAAVILSGLLLMLAAQSFSAIGEIKETGQDLYHNPVVRDDAVTPDPDRMDMMLAPETGPRVPVNEREIAAASKPAKSAKAPAAPKPGKAPPPEPNVQPGTDDTRPSLDELIALRAQDVSPEMVNEMRSLFPGIRLMDIASMYAVGATPEFVRQMRGAGLNVDKADDAQSLKAVDVTPDYVAAMRRLGFGITSAHDVQGMRAVGVTPEYVRAMRAAGFAMKSANEAQNLMAVGVTPDFVREMREAGVDLNESDAQSLCALGVTPEFVRKLAQAGYPHPTVSQLSRLAAAGVNGDFIREMSRYRTK